MKPRLRCAETRFAKLCKVSKGFNWVCAKLLVGCADSRFAEPRSSFLEGFNFVCAKPLLRRAESRFAKPRKFPAKGTVFGTYCGVQKVPQKHARTCKKLPVASFCASETAETGRIANGREQGDHVSRRQGGEKSTRSVPSRQGHRRKAEKFFALLFVLYKK